jgi:hypothetical protein
MLEQFKHEVFATCGNVDPSILGSELQLGTPFSKYDLEIGISGMVLQMLMQDAKL